ncbi:MAG: SHOCT domain-containing protein [Nitrosomonadales bacterium]|nr:SHOCT domain-containing protein [Nitrosomonadales bacterium]
MYPDHMWWGITWMIFPPLILIILILVPLFFWQRGYSCKTPEDRSETSMEILKKRYAKGEITKDEFEQIKKDIS